MMISNDNLQKVKNEFEKKVEYGRLRIDVDYPFFNVYENGKELIFSEGYSSYNRACEFADQEFYAQNPTCWNAFQNRVRWIGTLNGSKVIVDKDY